MLFIPSIVENGWWGGCIPHILPSESALGHVGNRVLDDDVMHTFAVEVERILKGSRITPLSDDSMDGACSTPNMLLNTKL